MVNEEVINYLIEGQKRGYSFDILKKNLMNGGFNENEINEAAMAASQRISLSQNIAKGTPSGQTKENNEEHYGMRWMKIAGIIGICYIALSVLFAILTFVFPKSYASLFQGPVNYIVYGIVFISIFLYYPSFIRLGRRAGSKFISFYGWVMTILPILVILLVIFAWGYLTSSLSLTGNAIINQGVSYSENNSSNSAIGYIFLGIFIAIILFYLTIQILFCVGLIKIGDRVRFSKAAGFLNLIAMIILIITLLTGIFILLFDPIFIATVMLSLMTGSFPAVLIIFIITEVVFYLLGLSSTFFISLALFDASKNYE